MNENVKDHGVQLVRLNAGGHESYSYTLACQSIHQADCDILWLAAEQGSEIRHHSVHTRAESQTHTGTTESNSCLAKHPTAKECRDALWTTWALMTCTSLCDECQEISD